MPRSTLRSLSFFALVATLAAACGGSSDQTAGGGGHGAAAGAGGSGGSGGTGGSTEDASVDVSIDVAGEASDDVSVDSALEAGDEPGDDGATDAASEPKPDAAADAPSTDASGATKTCAGDTVAVDDPNYGCSATGCYPCVLQNSTAKCAGGACAVAKCDEGFVDCNGYVGDGCERSIVADPLNCGGCGNVCTYAHSPGACAGGHCAIGPCNLGWGNCDHNDANGCESDVSSDMASCGACGHACPTGPDLVVCENAACKATACPAGLANCDANVGNGCETDLSSTVTHCGSCEKDCTKTQASVTCQAGTCKVIKCNVGWGDCDSDPSTCETNLSSLTSCGACGRTCTNGFSCSGNKCVCRTSNDCGSGGSCNGGTGICTCPNGSGGNITCGMGQHCANGGCMY